MVTVGATNCDQCPLYSRLVPPTGTNGLVLPRAQKFSPTSLAEGRRHLFISAGVPPHSSSSLMQAFGPKLATACGPIGPSAGLNPGPCRVSSRIQAVEAQQEAFFLVFSFLFLYFFGFFYFYLKLNTYSFLVISFCFQVTKIINFLLVPLVLNFEQFKFEFLKICVNHQFMNNFTIKIDFFSLLFIFYLYLQLNTYSLIFGHKNYILFAIEEYYSFILVDHNIIF